MEKEFCSFYHSHNKALIPSHSPCSSWFPLPTVAEFWGGCRAVVGRLRQEGHTQLPKILLSVVTFIGIQIATSPQSDLEDRLYQVVSTSILLSPVCINIFEVNKAAVLDSYAASYYPSRGNRTWSWDWLALWPMGKFLVGCWHQGTRKAKPPAVLPRFQEHLGLGFFVTAMIRNLTSYLLLNYLQTLAVQKERQLLSWHQDLSWVGPAVLVHSIAGDTQLVPGPFKHYHPHLCDTTVLDFLHVTCATDGKFGEILDAGKLGPVSLSAFCLGRSDLLSLVQSTKTFMQTESQLLLVSEIRHLGWPKIMWGLRCSIG